MPKIKILLPKIFEFSERSKFEILNFTTVIIRNWKFISGTFESTENYIPGNSLEIIFEIIFKIKKKRVFSIKKERCYYIGLYKPAKMEISNQTETNISIVFRFWINCLISEQRSSYYFTA